MEMGLTRFYCRIRGPDRSEFLKRRGQASSVILVPALRTIKKIQNRGSLNATCHIGNRLKHGIVPMLCYHIATDELQERGARMGPQKLGGAPQVSFVPYAAKGERTCPIESSHAYAEKITRKLSESLHI
jgi:hypothetical protein